MTECKCGELAHRDEYSRRLTRCETCDGAICRDCAWCGEGVHEECLECDSDRAHFAANRKLRAFYEDRDRARKERVRLRWNAEFNDLSAKVGEIVAAETGIPANARLPLWKDEQARSMRIASLMQREYERIEAEEQRNDPKPSVAQGGVS